MISSRMQKRLVKMAEKLVARKALCSESNGVCCHWLKLAESWGVKYTNQGYHYLREVFQNQRRGWRFHLGPFCFGFFKVTVDGDIFYGYITQIAIIATKFFGRNFSSNGGPTEYRKRVNRIKDIIQKKLDIYVNDLHSDNFGFIGKQIVITDWGFDG